MYNVEEGIEKKRSYRWVTSVESHKVGSLKFSIHGHKLLFRRRRKTKNPSLNEDCMFKFKIFINVEPWTAPGTLVCSWVQSWVRITGILYVTQDSQWDIDYTSGREWSEQRKLLMCGCECWVSLTAIIKCVSDFCHGSSLVSRLFLQIWSSLLITNLTVSYQQPMSHGRTLDHTCITMTPAFWRSRIEVTLFTFGPSLILCLTPSALIQA